MNPRRPAVALLLLLLAAVPGAAQHLGPSTGGIGALDQALRFLGHHKRVLMIAAHPDDEDTELLTVLVRGLGAEAAYLSLTRGEGGQNLIGPELGAALGVLRTEELLAARRLDGARQYFTRAYDFGYSKTIEDTWRFWPRDSVLKDVVRVIRRFRPQVVVSVFSGTPRDGHGQHQAAGWAADEAFRAAGDPAVFPELARDEGLSPWAPLKLYRTSRFDPGAATITLQGGVLDPAVGQSFRQIAMRGRSLHRSQDMGAAQPIGPSVVRIQLVEDRTGRGQDGFFAGIDTSLASLLSPSPSTAERLRADSIGSALRGLRPWAVGELPVLRRRFEALANEAGDQLSRMRAAEWLARGVVCDALADRERVVPGEGVRIIRSCWNTSADTARLAADLVVAGRPVSHRQEWRIPPAELVTDTLDWFVARETAYTQPYFLRENPAGSLYRWPPGRGGGEAFDPPYLAVEFRLEGAAHLREVVHRHVDQAVGEVRRPVRVVPRVAVALEPAGAVWPAGDPSARPFSVTLRHASREPTRGTVRLEVPRGWEVDAPQEFHLFQDGSSVVRQFTVRPPAGAAPGRVLLRAEARDTAGRSYTVGTVTVEYPHVRPRQLVQPAEARVVLAPVTFPADRSIAYVRGAADGIPEVLATLGLRVVLLGADSLARGDLSRFHTVVIGPRAYETEPALAEHNGRLLEFTRRGGTLVVQYQQQAYFAGGYAPFPIRLTDAAGPAGRVAAPRVAEEDAPVRLLQPGHPLFHAPNRIGATDWDGWVQERGLYFARWWSGEWTPLLEMADTGEPALQGSLLLAPFERGLYAYTGLSFFRQLPAGVPGAVRLFVNLLALEAHDGP